MTVATGVPVREIAVSAFRVPTDEPEADGTLTWDSTTLVLVEATAADLTGIGWTYAGTSSATLIRELLRDVVVGRDALAVPATWQEMVKAVRNLGRPGVASTAIAAVDIALWDLAARLVGLPLCRLLGQARDHVPVYGSGGFTSYPDDVLRRQLASWVGQGIPRVKIKVGESWGSRIARDLARARIAREVVGGEVELFVDANGGYTVGQAIRVGRAFDELGVAWFEEPVSSDDRAGLAAVRDRVRADVAAGEYGYDLAYYPPLIPVVDCVQADVSRTAGITEWRRVAATVAAHNRQISGHCAPLPHLHPAAAVPNLRHVEYFHDHVRIERMLFDGVPEPVGGVLHPDLTTAGIGVALKRADAEPYRVA